MLEMRRTDPAGELFGPEAYVFGDEVGRQAKSIRTAWENARDATGLGDFHLADIRHEAASRFEEAGVPTTYVSKFLGHRDLTTTTRYLNATLRGLRHALQKLEESQQSAPLANGLQSESSDELDASTNEQAPATPKSLIS